MAVAAQPAAPEAIQVFGARVNNLKNVSVEIPLNAMTVVTGVSGSGKSSLAFDTIYAEGQRRYVESLSAYARQFLDRMEKPDVDAIEGIAPAVAIKQKATTRNPRSTVATTTEIYDYLRLLYARVGETICPDCDIPVARNSVDAVVTQLFAQVPERRCYVLFPVVAKPETEAPVVEITPSAAKRAKKLPPVPAAPAAGLLARLAEMRGAGFPRLYQAGQLVEFSTPESLLQLDLTQPLYGVADRLAIEPETRGRLVDAIETAYRETGEAVFLFPDVAPGAPGHTLRFNEKFECKQCGRAFEEPEPRLFSFNNPFGACPRCQGFGNTTDFDPAKVVPNPTLSLAEGAIHPATTPRALPWRNALKKYAAANGIPMFAPWAELSPAQQAAVLDGDGKFSGVKGFFEHLESKKYKVHVRVFLSRYRGYAKCPACHGERLRPEALWVRLGPPGQRLNIAQAATLTVARAHTFFASLELQPEQQAIASAVLLEVRRRLEFLLKVGLQYLTLDRMAGTLSGGEAQRIQLATCLGSRLVGSMYVLDEPSIGLHARDTRRLIEILHELRDLGNTILVVEHDAEVMRASDYLLDMGPAAGELGGSVVSQGTFAQVRADKNSLTGKYLRGEKTIPTPSLRRSPGRHVLEVVGAHANNLKNIDLEIPLGLLVAVTGVSGSGKSSLVHQVLHRSLRAKLGLNQAEAADMTDLAPEVGLVGCRDLRGISHLNEVVLVDQSPIGRTPRSNPITYLKAFDGVRELFASQPEARKRGYRAGHFSFNVPGGRCETCQGDGVVTLDMQFLADVALVCEECDGSRYQAGILEVKVQGKNIHQVLGLTVHEAIAFFAQQPKIVRSLRLLEEVGLGYLRLGQSATTLSGGEAQRLKLAAHLAQPRSAERTLFLFDEPTTGLHFDDIAKLLHAFERLLAAGGSVIVIEHNLEVIKSADWVLDLGPEGGAAGGNLVAEGPPEVVARAQGSYTAPFLAAALAG